MTGLQELKLSDQLFGLYVDVLETLAEWKHVSPSKHALRLKSAFDQLIQSRFEHRFDETFGTSVYC